MVRPNTISLCLGAPFPYIDFGLSDKTECSKTAFTNSIIKVKVSDFLNQNSLIIKEYNKLPFMLNKNANVNIFDNLKSIKVLCVCFGFASVCASCLKKTMEWLKIYTSNVS